ncbi:MAG: DUF4013 domain-containing protein [Thermoflexales bacterium]|nr:DUF4013 domain-containing protein [Thermoflexales bacterium]MDW8318604.1 DUF4013 domain-containing protein [Anaerolineae bacterium]
MDIGKSFSFVFEDPRWVDKVLIGAGMLILGSLLSVVLIGVIPVFIVGGYALETLRNVRRGERYPMPEWKDRWGEWLMLGLKLWVVTLIWSLPMFVLIMPMAVALAITGQQELEGAAAVIALCSGLAVFAWGLVVALASPAIYTRVAETEEIGAGLRFGEILSFTRQHLGEVIIATLVLILASLVFSLAGFLIGLLLCLVGVVVTLPAVSFIVALVQSHLYAQVGMPSPKPWQTGLAPVEAAE